LTSSGAGQATLPPSAVLAHLAKQRETPAVKLENVEFAEIKKQRKDQRGGLARDA